MKLGEKLQQLRKKSGLSQEQLAAQITVSRQAVSKWELDETMPDTDNILQLARIFGVSCDYLLRDEVEESGAVQPIAPGDRHSPSANDRSGGASAALGVCSFGLVVAFMFYRFNGHTVRPLAIGFLIQVLGVVLFERSAARMAAERTAARLNFYRIACWLMLPSPLIVLAASLWEAFGRDIAPLQALILYFVLYLLLGTAITAVLTVLRRRTADKT